MVELIQHLLYTHNCVIIPKFGAFIANYEPAALRLQDNVIFPPSKLIAFNKSLKKNDGLLIHALIDKSHISYHDAEILVNEFAENCNHLLYENKSLIFEGIGKFKLDAENNIQFQPYHSINYNLNSFGLPKLNIYPIHRLKDNESKIKESYQRKLHPEYVDSGIPQTKKFSKKWLLLIAAFLLMFLIPLSYIGFNKKHTIQDHSQSSLLPELQNSAEQQTKATISIKVSDTKDLNKENNNSTPLFQDANNTKPDQAASFNNKATTHIVIGSFFDNTRAAKLKLEAESKGYLANIIKDDLNGLFRTIVQVNNKEANVSLQKIKTDLNSRAYVLCSNCKLN